MSPALAWHTWRVERERGEGGAVQVPVVGCHLFRKCSRRSSMSKSNRSRGVALWKYLSDAIDICRRRTGNAICPSNLWILKAVKRGSQGGRGKKLATSWLMMQHYLKIGPIRSLRRRSKIDRNDAAISNFPPLTSPPLLCLCSPCFVCLFSDFPNMWHN